MSLTLALNLLLLKREYVLMYVPKALDVVRSIWSRHVILPSKMTPRYFALFTKWIFRPFSWSWFSGFQSQSQSYFTTDDQSVRKSWFQGPLESHDLIFISVDIYEYCFIDYGRPLWREVGSVICLLVTWTASVQYSKFSAGPRQHSISPYL
jgi:hypothetical protein